MGFISQKWLNIKAEVGYRKLLRFTKTTLSQIFADTLQNLNGIGSIMLNIVSNIST
jgi:hypothetical protein